MCSVHRHNGYVSYFEFLLHVVQIVKKRGQIHYLIILTILYAKEGCQCQNYAPGISQKARLVKKYHRCA